MDQTPQSDKQVPLDTGLAGLVLSALATAAPQESTAASPLPQTPQGASDAQSHPESATSSGLVDVGGAPGQSPAQGAAAGAAPDVVSELANLTSDDVFGPKVSDTDTPFLSVQALEKAAAAEQERIKHAKDRAGREAGITSDERDAQRQKRIDEFTQAVLNARQDERKPIVLPPIPPGIAERTRLEIEAGRATSAMHADRRGYPSAKDKPRPGVVLPGSTPVFRPANTTVEMGPGFKSPREGNIRPGTSADL